MPHSSAERSSPHDVAALAQFVELCAALLGGAATEAMADSGKLVEASLSAGREVTELQDEIEASASRSLPKGFSTLLASIVGISSNLQWMDRFGQRLTHIETQLREFAELLQASGGAPSDSEWQQFLDATRASYTMEAEREVFDETFATNAMTTPEEETDAANTVLF